MAHLPTVVARLLQSWHIFILIYFSLSCSSPFCFTFPDLWAITSPSVLYIPKFLSSFQRNQNGNYVAANMASERTWDIVVLGATGYTGRCAVEHIYTHTPTSLKWAVAGRDANKLGDIVSRFQKTYPDRKHPGMPSLST